MCCLKGVSRGMDLASTGIGLGDSRCPADDVTERRLSLQAQKVLKFPESSLHELAVVEVKDLRPSPPAGHDGQQRVILVRRSAAEKRRREDRPEDESSFVVRGEKTEAIQWMVQMLSADSDIDDSHASVRNSRQRCDVPKRAKDVLNDMHREGTDQPSRSELEAPIRSLTTDDEAVTICSDFVNQMAVGDLQRIRQG